MAVRRFVMLRVSETSERVRQILKRYEGAEGQQQAHDEMMKLYREGKPVFVETLHEGQTWPRSYSVLDEEGKKLQ